jgi:glycine cleavage system H protein
MKLDATAKYQATHEWVRREGDLIVCGITDHAQESLSDVVYMELPDVGDTLQQGEAFGVVESVKAASDLYMPMSGEIAAVNDRLEDEPELINSDPFGAGWMIKFAPTDMSEWDGLLSGAAYEKAVEAEG